MEATNAAVPGNAGSAPTHAIAQVTAFAAQKWVSLTSFKRDGQPVSTPVAFVTEGDRLLFRTPDDTFKVKRLRRNAEVRLAACTASGKITGPEHSGRAIRLTDGHPEIRRRLLRKYPVSGRIFELRARAKKSGFAYFAVVDVLPND